MVPNHIIEQVGREAKQWYPAANVLLGSSATTADGRRRFIAQSAASEWDIVIVPQSAFTAINVSTDVRTSYMEKQLDDLRAQLDNATIERSQKAIMRAIKTAQARVEKLLAHNAKDTGLRFEESGCDYLLVEEAHYIKNPAALRTRNSRALIDGCDRAVLLTGTPLENRIEEFRNLVTYLQPKLVVDTDGLSPSKFRRQVAPAYLRRNQEDVLTELPDQVEVDEWLTFSDEDAAAYRAAVGAGNFMTMRQAAMLGGPKSIKLQRLVEIVGEAEDNGRRVVVFSYFRDVLDQVARALPGRVFGPLTGSVPAPKRQALIDEFSAAGHGAVLVAQIVAGGVGLNIQAASVVVICEPQLKPTTEWQAIARARRMGQLESVQVHRLLSEEGVDQRIRDILARKSELFEEFARESDTAKSAPEAYDVSEAQIAREIIAEERERLFSQVSQAT